MFFLSSRDLTHFYGTFLISISLIARSYTPFDSSTQAIYEEPTKFLEILLFRLGAIASFFNPPKT
jgi:hypothetical protein